MRYQYSKLLFLLALVFSVIFSCQKEPSFQERYFSESNVVAIKSYLDTLGFKEDELKRKVILFSPSLSCPPFFSETQYWQDNLYLYPDIDFSLVILTKYEMSARALVKSEGIKIPYKQDSTDILQVEKLLPELPVKIYFDKDGILAKISSMNGNVEEFSNLIK